MNPKINHICLGKLRNDEHFQYGTDYLQLIHTVGAEKLKVQSKFNLFDQWHNQEDVAMKRVVKSALTETLHELNKQRKRIFKGLKTHLRITIEDFDPKVAEAARRVDIIFDTYGNIYNKPMNEASSTIFNLLQHLNDHFAEDLATIMIERWTNELEICNQKIQTLMMQRYKEYNDSLQPSVKGVRKEVDKIYYEINEVIEAHAILDDSTEHREFISLLNVIIDKYNQLAKMHGSNRKKSDETPATPAGEAPQAK